MTVFYRSPPASQPVFTSGPGSETIRYFIPSTRILLGWDQMDQSGQTARDMLIWQQFISI